MYRALALSLALVAPLAAPLAAQQAEPRPAPRESFEHVLPEDTLAFLCVPDTETLCSEFAASPAGTWWKDPANDRLREVISQHVAALNTVASAMLGVDPLALPGMLHGRVSVAVIGALAPEHDERPTGLSVALLADTGEDREACQGIVGTLFDKLGEIEHMVRKSGMVGETEITVIESLDEESAPQVRFQMAFHEDTLVLLVSFLPVERDAMETLLARLDGEAGASLASAPGFRSSLAVRGSMKAWADGARMVEWIRQSMEADVAKHADDEEEWAREHYAEELKTMENCGLFDIGTFSMTSGWSDKGSQMLMRLDWPGEGWVPAFARLALRPGGEKLFAAVPGGVLSAAAANVDFGGIFDKVLELLIETGEIPPSGAVDFLAEAEAELGFNPRDDLIDALDGPLAIVTAKVPPEERFVFAEGDPQNYAAILALTDGARVNTLIEDLVRKMGMHAGRKRTEFQGFEMFSLPIMPGFEVHYAVLPDMAVVSLSGTMLQDVLRRKAGGADLPVLAADKDFKARSAQLAGPGGVMQYTNSSESMKTVAAMLDKLREVGLEGLGAEATGDPMVGLASSFLKALPPLDPAVIEKHFKGATIVAVGMDERGLLFESLGP